MAEEPHIVIDDEDFALAMYLNDVEQSSQQQQQQQPQHIFDHGARDGHEGDVDGVILLDQSNDSVTAMDVSDGNAEGWSTRDSNDSEGVIVLGEEGPRRQNTAGNFNSDRNGRRRRRPVPSLASARARELRQGRSPAQAHAQSSRTPRGARETEQGRQDRLLAERLQQEEQDRLLSFGSGLMGADGTDGGSFGPAYGLDADDGDGFMPRVRRAGRGSMHPHPDAGQLAQNLALLGSSSSRSVGPVSGRTRTNSNSSARHPHPHWPASPPGAWPPSVSPFRSVSSSSSASSSSSSSSSGRGRATRWRGAGHPTGGGAPGPSHWAWMNSVAGGYGGWAGGSARFGGGVNAQTQALAQAQASLGIDFDNLPNDGSTYEQLLALDDRIEKRGLSVGERDALTASAVVTAADAKRLRQRGDKCAICLDEYEEKQRTRRLPCMCTFHQQCIDTHLKQSVQCPICRVEITSATSQ